MPYLSVPPPFPVFENADGEPLRSGFVFVGEENKDPEANPITVFWDADLTQPVAQPIRTNNGFLSRTGTPARVYSNVNYSITVKDKKEVIVYTSLADNTQGEAVNLVFIDVAEMRAFTGSRLSDSTSVTLIGGSLPGDGAGGDFFWNLTSTASEDAPSSVGTVVKLTTTPTGRFIRTDQDSLSIKYYGAKGGGLTDENSEISLWITALEASGGTGNIVPGTYLFTQLTIVSRCTIKGAGGVLKLKDNTTDQDDNSSFFPILVTGDDITISGIEIDGNGANNRPAVPLSLWVADTITLLGADNLVLKDSFIHDSPDSGIMFSECTNSSVSGNHVFDMPDAGIYTNDSAGTILDYDAETGTFTPSLVLTGGTSGATGTIVSIIDDGTTGTITLSGVSGTFQDNEIITDSSTGSATANGRSGPRSRGNIVSKNRIERAVFAGIALKRNVEFISVEGNTIFDCGNGITIEDFGSATDPDRFVIANNIIRNIGFNFTSDPLVAGNGMNIQECEGATISGNHLFDVENQAFRVTGAQNCLFSGNHYTGSATSDATDGHGWDIGPRNSHGTTNCVFIGNFVFAAKVDAFRIINGVGDHTGNKVIGNFFQSTTGNAIRIDDEVKNCQFINNTCDGFIFDINQNAASGTVVSNLWSNNTLVNGTINGFLDARTACWNSTYGNDFKITASVAAPTIGTWKVGEKSFNTLPSADGNQMIISHWVNTVAGTPGTWTPQYVSTVTPAT